MSSCILQIGVMKMKEILVLEASPRKGYSTRAAGQLAERLGRDHHVDLVALRDLNILPCKGCGVCLSRGSSYCPNRSDDTVGVLQKMEQADGVVIVVPNYSLQVTAQLKQLFDRLAYVFHRPRLFGKIFMPMVVQGVYGGGRVCKYMNEVMEFWGMTTVKGGVLAGAVHVNRPQSEEVTVKNQKVLDKAADKFLRELSNEAPRQPSLFRMMIFRSTRSGMKYSPEALPADKAYFEEKGWLSSDYYYPVRIGIFKRGVGNLVDVMMKRMINSG